MIRVRQIKINVKEYSKELLLKELLKKLKISKTDIIKYEINKRSIDARDKSDVCYVFEIDVLLKEQIKVRLSNDIVEIENNNYDYKPNGIEKLSSQPVIIGSGPCGLFCAYMLAKYGYKPIVFERGEEIDKRVISVNEFWKTNKLNKNSNVQFGEGGAGTFSDGKLNTQIKDKNNRIKEVLKTFVANGAPEEILYDFMPHIGTDKLRNVIKNMREEIIKMGGTFNYNSCLTDIVIENNKVKKIKINDKEIPCDILVLAIGHSSRDTFRMLHKIGLNMTNKPFAIGLRIMHPQEMIDKNQYGDYSSYLQPANYKLIHNINGHGIYSFCMCPGGYVVNASSEENRLVINGMSNYERESGIANSALVVTVNQEDYGNELFSGMEFQKKLESKAYEIGKGKIPIQAFKDYENNNITTEFTEFLPKIKGNYTYANLNNLFSENINNILKSGVNYFNNKIKGFNSDKALLAGLESRTSSPIRIERNTNLESNIEGIYPGGEGAGYAGGITSAAIDGIKIFEAITSKFSI